jgi:hypothetical protein
MAHGVLTSLSDLKSEFKTSKRQKTYQEDYCEPVLGTNCHKQDLPGFMKDEWKLKHGKAKLRTTGLFTNNKKRFKDSAGSITTRNGYSLVTVPGHAMAAWNPKGEKLRFFDPNTYQYSFDTRADFVGWFPTYIVGRGYKTSKCKVVPVTKLS